MTEYKTLSALRKFNRFCSSKIQHIGAEMRINHTDESAVVALGQVISN